MLTDTIFIKSKSGQIHKRIVREFMKAFFQSSNPRALKEGFEDRFPDYEILINDGKVSLMHRKDGNRGSESVKVKETGAP